MADVFIAIGSNYRRKSNVRFALQRLLAEFEHVRTSPLYASKALDPKDAEYWNLVVHLSTKNSPQQVRQTLKKIERNAGRVKGSSQVCLDLDLLLYDQDVVDAANFSLPHPDILTRAYVLKPLSDLAPHREHPETAVSYGESWQQMMPDAPPLSVVAATPLSFVRAG